MEDLALVFIIVMVWANISKHNRRRGRYRKNYRTNYKSIYKPKTKKTKTQILSFPQKENKNQFVPIWQKIIKEDGTEYYILANQDEADERLRNMPYEKKNILTRTEYEFWKILKEKCNQHNIIVCPKVRMEDFIDVTAKDYSTKQSYRGKIKSRHIDFILCDEYLNILAGLELDDKSHLSTDAKIIDEFKDNVFKRIGVPLHRVIVDQGNYHLQIDALLIKLGFKTTIQIDTKVSQ